ncbi:MAG: 50S ribosomal protein L24 [Pirellulales bacterium]|nr:50S ribosomal protein L24 [Pirellulales bacterium]
MHVRVNDTVEVIAGDDEGARGKVLRVNRAENRIVVEGVNRVYKHVRRSQRNPQGGRLSREMPIALSNVALVCGACGKATRVGARFLDDGSKERFCKKCGAANGQIAPSKEQDAKK